MIDPRKLLGLAAKVNSKYGHETDAQAKFLQNEYLRKHGSERTREERRKVKAQMREQMFGKDQKSEFSVPELEKLVQQ